MVSQENIMLYSVFLIFLFQLIYAGKVVYFLKYISINKYMCKFSSLKQSKMFFFLNLLCVIGGTLVFQSPSLTVDDGTNVTLTCDIANAFGQCSSVRCLLYQQENGLRIYNPGFRTITTKAEQDTLCSLKISQTSPSDNGTFYCLLLNEGVDYMGNGTALIVMGKCP